MKALQRANDQEAVVERLEGDWHDTYLSGDDYWAKQKVCRFPEGCGGDFGAERLPEDSIIVLDGSCPEGRTEVLKALGDGMHPQQKPIIPKRYNVIVFNLPDKDMRMTSWRPRMPPPGQRVEHVSTAIAWLNSLPIKEAKVKKKARSSSAPAGRRKGLELPTILDALKLAVQMKPRRIWVAARGGNLDKTEPLKVEETRTLLKTCDVATKGAGVPYIVQKVVLWDATENDTSFWSDLTGTDERVDTIDTKKELGDLGNICKGLKTQKKKVTKGKTSKSSTTSKESSLEAGFGKLFNWLTKAIATRKADITRRHAMTKKAREDRQQKLTEEETRENQKKERLAEEEERRVDPADGKARSRRRMDQKYAGQYSEQEMDEYWANCQVWDGTYAEPQYIAAAGIKAAGIKEGGSDEREQWKC